VIHRRYAAALFVSYLLWAVILTYPLVQQPFSHIPLGDEKVATVPFFNLWTLQWNIDQLMQGYPNYWDAPIFAPLSGTFAFSETQPLSALLAAPFWLGFQSPAFGYNVIVILFLTLNGWFAHWLLQSWQLPKLPAFLGGLIMMSLPFVAQEMGVLQLIALFGLLWSLLFLSRFLRDARSWKNSIGLALGMPVTFFTCGYYGLFSVFFLPLFFITQLQRIHLKPVALIRLSIIGVLIIALSGPFLLAQKQRLDQHGFTRSAQTIQNNSAKLKYYANFLDYNLLYGQLLGVESGAGQRLLPGIGLMVLAIVGLFGGGYFRIKLYLGLAVILALLLSLGLRLQLGPIQLYQWIREVVPGFLQLRSPFRFAGLVQLHLALLAGFGLYNLYRWLPRGGQAGTVIATLIILFESLALPLPLQSVPNLNEQAQWQAWLQQRQQPSRIVMLPFAPSNRVADFAQTTHWMLMQPQFEATMLNGYSGFFPADRARLVITVVVDEPTMPGPGYGGLVAAPAFRNVAEFCIQALAIPPSREEPPRVSTRSLESASLPNNRTRARPIATAF